MNIISRARKSKHASAFPHNPEGFIEELGLSKREYFAGLAMQALIGSKDYSDYCKQNMKEASHDIVATVSLRYADALLSALEE